MNFGNNMKLKNNLAQTSNTYPSAELSSCHKAPVKVSGDNREGTHYYVCTKCWSACDLFSAEEPVMSAPSKIEPKDESIELEALFLDKILLIDQLNHISFAGSDDEHMAFVLLGTPSQLIKQLEALLIKGHCNELEKLLKHGGWHADDWGIDCIYRQPIENRLTQLSDRLKKLKEQK